MHRKADGQPRQHAMREAMDSRQKDRRIKKKRTRQDYADDGRVIANMNVAGMPRSIVQRIAFDEFGVKRETRAPVSLADNERWAIISGIILSYLLYGLLFFGLLALFIWLAITFWFI